MTLMNQFRSAIVAVHSTFSPRLALVVALLVAFASAAPVQAQSGTKGGASVGTKKAGKPLPQVLLQTSKGDVVLELFEDQAPNTVANFVSLVEKGFYNGLKFHRVIDSFMAQGGRSERTRTGGPGYRIACECYRPDAKKHTRGTISMAHAGRNTGGSQFFIMFDKNPGLDGKHTAFGRVVKGMDVVDKLTRTVDKYERPIPGAKPDVIKKAKVTRKRKHEYKPKKV